MEAKVERRAREILEMPLCSGPFLPFLDGEEAPGCTYRYLTRQHCITLRDA